MKLKYFIIPLVIVGAGVATFIILKNKHTKVIRERGFKIEVELDEN